MVSIMIKSIDIVVTCLLYLVTSICSLIYRKLNSKLAVLKNDVSEFDITSFSFNGSILFCKYVPDRRYIVIQHLKINKHSLDQ